MGRGLPRALHAVGCVAVVLGLAPSTRSSMAATVATAAAPLGAVVTMGFSGASQDLDTGRSLWGISPF